METIGIRKIVNGPFTFAPDGNPLVGPVRGLRNFWVACGVMAGLSQGGGVGLALATWMTSGDHGDSGMDIWGMDVARFGDYATLAYTNAKVQENYRRRFRITFPNEELPAARPLLTTPIHDRLTERNAVWGAMFGLEHALWFQEPGLEPKEEVTFHRSNAWKMVGEEVRNVREKVGVTDISNYAKYRVTGPGAEAWLSGLLTARMPAAGRMTLTAMLNEGGRIVGEFPVAGLDRGEQGGHGGGRVESELGLAHRAARLERLGDLVVQFHAVGGDYKRPVARHLAQHLLREEHHREALAAALRLPEHAAAPVAQLARLQHRRDGLVHTEELVVLAEHLHQPGLVLGEEREVLRQVEQAAVVAGAAQHYLQRHAARLVLALDALPLEEATPVCGERPDAAVGSC